MLMLAVLEYMSRLRLLRRSPQMELMRKSMSTGIHSQRRVGRGVLAPVARVAVAQSKMWRLRALALCRRTVLQPVAPGLALVLAAISAHSPTTTTITTVHSTRRARSSMLPLLQ